MSNAQFSLRAGNSALLVVDIQEAFRKAIPDFSLTVANAAIAVRGCEALGVPVLVTEQYPAGLGRTAEELLLSFSSEPSVFEKTAFSAYRAEGLNTELARLAVGQIILCGFETHVCVNQTAHDLLAAGFAVHLLSDAVASRFEHDRNAGIAKMYQNGVVPSSVEMALFELMNDAKHPKFKDIQALIK
mgnify:CR=1 FL=1